MVADEKLAERQRMAPAGAVRRVDLPDLIAQMPCLRNEVPQQVLDPLRLLIGDIAVDLEHVDGLAVLVARKFEMKSGIARPVQERGEVRMRQSRTQDVAHVEMSVVGTVEALRLLEANDDVGEGALRMNEGLARRLAPLQLLHHLFQGVAALG